MNSNSRDNRLSFVHRPSAILRSHVQTLSRKHGSFAHEGELLRYVYATFKIHATSCIGYMRKYRFDNTCTFTIQDYGEHISPQYAASACCVAVQESDLQVSDQGTTNLEDEDGSVASRFLLSDTLSQCNIIIRYSDTRTIRAAFKDFVERIGAIIEVDFQFESVVVVGVGEISQISKQVGARWLTRCR